MAEKIKVGQLCGWSPVLADGLACAVGDDEDIIALEVNNGEASAFSFDDGKAFCVLRVDGDELVVVCFEGENLTHYCPLLIECAKAIGMKSLRFHTRNKVLGRMVRKFGVIEKETIYQVVF